ncbi:spore germination protein [Clostridium botulinum]|uniref:Spore germination protein n=2 Tax=Clostridium botulinum TaxID=1491 RepID=A0A846HVH4_CLOBO|nr:spore germination protein [Clostridium botulinum]AJD27186.1 GerA spore germination family protein [Clostridium botulinum CDC_297]ACQ52901.1 spore germination protein, GerAA [Clostridium botulinum Ba4 str. 657]AJE12112.1 GerA spore germination family protein [Clostridium botulinum CDC_1436]APQ71671.1 GerA spore germination family protein [Clostridium botulinum]APU61738.1 GerA spore germination family protein [Clostridium botulinum]
MRDILDDKIKPILDKLNAPDKFNVKKINLGKGNNIKIALVYDKDLIDRNIISDYILKPLMLHVEESFTGKENITEILMEKYICVDDTILKTDTYEITDLIKKGFTAVFVPNSKNTIIINTVKKNYKSIIPPEIESSIRGPKEAFTESIESNLSQINRRIKDKNLRIERFIVGERSQTEVAIIYIEDIADEKLVNKIKERVNLIKVDHVKNAGYVEEYIENNSYTVFPQSFTTERPDVMAVNIMEGRIGILMEGSQQGITVPAIFIEFFQTVEDYNAKFMLSTVIRFFRVIAVVLVLSLTSIYLTLVKFNVELLPDKLLQPIVQSRVGIALSPIMEIVSMELIVEFLREGGLRLPSKIGQTLSVVGGIIIGDAAIKSHLVSSTTLLVVGVSTVATFLIPNYEMSLAIRIIKFPILFLTNALGLMGVSIGWFFIVVELCSLDSMGVPYLQFKKSDMKDTFIRAPLWKMNKRPKAIPNKNPVRQKDFRKKFRGKHNGKQEE